MDIREVGAEPSELWNTRNKRKEEEDRELNVSYNPKTQQKQHTKGDFILDGSENETRRVLPDEATGEG